MIRNQSYDDNQDVGISAPNAMTSTKIIVTATISTPLPDYQNLLNNIKKG